MAAYSVEAAKHANTSAGTVDVISFSDRGTGLRIRNRDTDQALYFRFDGVDPAVAGDDSYFVGTGESLEIDQGGVSEVRVISNGVCEYSVEVY